jgi:CheY-like chemotaxis protein
VAWYFVKSVMFNFIEAKDKQMKALHPSRDIILADDDRDDVEVFQMSLQELKIPHSLRHAEDGNALFVLLKEQIPYMLFLDINMPHKDGMACIREIRKNSDYDTMPVVMYTSHTASKIVDECFSHGANLYMPKGYTLSDLIGKLQKIFSIDWHRTTHYPAKTDFVVN